MLRLVITLAILYAFGAATNVKQCKSGKPAPLSVNVVGCAETPCDVVKGETAVMEVHFLGNKNDIKEITTKVRAKTFGITVPYDLPEDVANVCSNLMYGANCPIYKDEDVTYQFNFYIDSSYPEISVEVEVSLVDGENDTIACFVCNCKVRKGTSGNKYQLFLE